MDRIRIEGPRITLRPLRMAELDASIAARLAAGPAVVRIKPDREKLRVRFERSGLMVDGACDLAIDLDGVRIGEIQTYVPRDRELAPGTYEVGLGIDDPSLRGRGYGREAVALLVGWLFENGAEQINMRTTESNTAMRMVLERLGFHTPGTAVEDGTEFVIYEITRDAWRARRPAQ